ncbi:PilN domain-containing protein [Lysinibacillus sp. NPDC097195]|uniref:PilN domain-containing protein n=1 Tax=Lysinibacillus sp. NPDC097195 TaxID=3364141 RepID=UPI0037F1E25E
MVPDINLLPQLEKRTASPKLFYGVLIVIVGLILAYFLLLYFTATSDIKRLQLEEQTLTTERDQLQQTLNEQQLSNKGNLQQSVQYVQSIAYPVTPLIDETRQLLPAHAYLRSYVFGQDTINILVDFESMPDIATYVERLLVSHYFKDTQISSIANFEVQVGEQKELTPEQKFTEVPRYSVSITATIDFMYLAGGRPS